MTITTVSIDLGKNTMHVVALDESGSVSQRRICRSRTALTRYLAKLPACRVAMEACAGAHYIGRKAKALDHDARLLPGQYVRAYAKGQKNDYADAEAIAEAATRPTMREVPIKSISQQELQLLHRQRTGWIGQRTQTANRTRAILGEFGVTLSKGLHKLREQLPWILEDAENGLPDYTRVLLHELYGELLHLDDRVGWVTRELERMARTDSGAQLLLSVPGIGPMIATAMRAAIGDARAFRRGRDLAAWLGLVPQQYSTGGRTRLLGISKRGNRALHTLLVHGARALLRTVHRRNDALAGWVARLRARKPENIVVVAVANKLARVSQAVLVHQQPFQADALVA